jgi:hypothetical protein
MARKFSIGFEDWGGGELSEENERLTTEHSNMVTTSVQTEAFGEWENSED